LKLKVNLEKTIKKCDKCNLGSPKSLSWGNKNAKVLFIGINPSLTITKDRLCFQSQAFTVLYQAMKELKKNVNDYFYMNLIMCATPENREPSKEEIANCSSFFMKTVNEIKPKKIICFGKVVGEQLGLKKNYVGIPMTSIGHFSYDAYLFRHPSFIKRFPKNYEIFKRNLGVVLR